MIPYRRHLIVKGSNIKQALQQLNELAADAILFVVTESDVLIGSLTDGDVRRGFLRGLGFENVVEEFIQANPKIIIKGHYDINDIIEFRERNFRILPVVDNARKVTNIINFRFIKSYLPVDAVIMAGGKGERLKPLTDSTPKPLLKVGGQPIIEHNINRLIKFGIDDFWLSIRYLGDQLVSFFGDGARKNVNIEYVREDIPLGTIGALSKVKNFRHDFILLTNSDILTNLDYEDFFLEFIRSGADVSVVTIPYSINIPYAVLETTNGHVVSLKEKPTYTYFSNGGIYLMKRSVIDFIPKDTFFNATDLMEKLITDGLKVHSYPLRGYWLDIGKPEDFLQAQEDIKHIKF